MIVLTHSLRYEESTSGPVTWIVEGDNVRMINTSRRRDDYVRNVTTLTTFDNFSKNVKDLRQKVNSKRVPIILERHFSFDRHDYRLTSSEIERKAGDYDLFVEESKLNVILLEEIEDTNLKQVLVGIISQYHSNNLKGTEFLSTKQFVQGMHHLGLTSVIRKLELNITVNYITRTPIFMIDNERYSLEEFLLTLIALYDDHIGVS